MCVCGLLNQQISILYLHILRRIGDIERKLKEAEAREEALLRRITEKEKALNKMRYVDINTSLSIYSRGGFSQINI